MKAKREINYKRKQQATPKKVDYLTVQRLSSDVSGKAQKFSRIGPREFVSYPHGDLTIDNIKKACETHFLSQLKMNVECDILAGEQGPSCSSFDLKLIHIRFVGTAMKRDSWVLLITARDCPETARDCPGTARSRKLTARSRKLTARDK